MRYRILFAFVATVLITNGCLQSKTPTFTPSQSTAISPRATDSLEKVVAETPTIQPTQNSEQNSNLTFQCLDIQSSLPSNFKFVGKIILKGYYGSRTLYALQPSNGITDTTILDENILAPVISPDGKLLAYLDDYDRDDTSKLILVNSNNEVQRAFHWRWGFVWGPVFSWINNNQLAINPYSHEQMIIFNPFTNDTKSIAFDQFPEFNFILNLPWANYDPTLTRIIYPKGDSLALFDAENSQVLAEVPAGEQRLSTHVAWAMDGISAAIIGSIFPFTDNMSDELFIVSRDGVAEQVTHLSNYYEHVSLHSPSWSPNGKLVALWEKDSLDDYKLFKLIVINLNTKEAMNYCISSVLDDRGFHEYLPEPKWSPDNSQILVENRYSEDHNNIILIDISKNIAVQIAQDARPIGWMTSP